MLKDVLVLSGNEQFLGVNSPNEEAGGGSSLHPRQVLLQGHHTPDLPVCDHYSGVWARMEKSLALQREMTKEFGRCVFDVTLDCEDGAPSGGELEHAQMVAELVEKSDTNARVAVRVHGVHHPSFEQDMHTIMPKVAHRLCHIMLPKVQSAQDIEYARKVLQEALKTCHYVQEPPLHALIESPLAVHHAFEIAAHGCVQSLSFGLMDFVSSFNGAIGDRAMGMQGALNQFSHPLVVQAKIHIASAAAAYGKVPAHCVITEFTDLNALSQAVERVVRELAYMRMWSIHPSQIRPILKAFEPSCDEVDKASAIVANAYAQAWAPIKFEGKLHDKASYRYYWQVLERAHRVGVKLDSSIQSFFV